MRTRGWEIWALCLKYKSFPTIWKIFPRFLKKLSLEKANLFVQCQYFSGLQCGWAFSPPGLFYYYHNHLHLHKSPNFKEPCPNSSEAVSTNWVLTRLPRKELCMYWKSVNILMLKKKIHLSKLQDLLGFLQHFVKLGGIPSCKEKAAPGSCTKCKAFIGRRGLWGKEVSSEEWSVSSGESVKQVTSLVLTR